MFRRIWAASELAHDVLRFAPTNIILAAIHTRRGLKWGIPAMLLAIPYLYLASLLAVIVRDGGPGWLNLVVLLCAWNSIKLILNGPSTVILLIRAILRDHRAHRAAGSVERGSPTPA